MIKKRPDINLHFHARPEERKTGLWLESVGHYANNYHYLPGRITDGIVINYCVDGEGEYWVGERRYTQRKGDIYLAPSNIFHRYGCNTDTGWEIYWLHMSGELAARMASQAGFTLSRWHLTIGIHKELITIFRQLMDEVRNPNLYTGLHTTSLLFTLLTEICIRTHTSEPEYHELDRALEGAPANVDEMAAATHLSKCHFVRKFHKITGTTPWRLVIQRRISEAKELLCTTELTIKEIAAQLEMKDPNYFSRLFRRETGVSATEYRKRHRQG